ncbi:MAG TPA: DUF3592 domain-containing protein [Sphingobium sp.]
MTYTADPLQGKIGQFFHHDGNSFFYSPPKSEISVVVTEDEYFDAEEKIKTYSARAKGVTLVIGGLVAGWIYWQVFHDAPIIPTSIVGFFAFFTPALLANILAMRLVLRPYQKRLQRYTRDELGWVRKGWVRGIRDLGVPPISVAIAILIFIVLVPLGLRDFYHRSIVLREGANVSASVTRSDADNAKNTCVVEYSYLSAGGTYAGRTIGCEVMRQHPVGATLVVRVASDDPSYSVAENEDLWTADAGFPFFLIGLSVVMIISLLSAARSYSPPDPLE